MKQSLYSQCQTGTSVQVQVIELKLCCLEIGQFISGFPAEGMSLQPFKAQWAEEFCLSLYKAIEEGCETLRVPQYLDNRLTDGGKVVSLTHRPPFTPPGTGIKGPCSPLKFNRRCDMLSRWFLPWLSLWPWRWRRHVPPKCQLTFDRLHGDISQKIERFITTTMRTSNPTNM
jgi:hypothetical protein